MLDELRIRGLGVIDDATLVLGPGLTAVTGETGAGKTMVVTGLLLLFGGRADSARVRSGAGQATVDGRLLLPAGSAGIERVRDAGGEVDGAPAEEPAGSTSDHTSTADVVLRRIVTAAGRSRAYVGGAPAPVAVLGELADQLLTVHGQADQAALTQPAAQRTMLDRYAGIDASAYEQAYRQWRSAVAEHADRTARAAQLRRESDLLAHGLAEIDRVAPAPDELDELTRLAGRLGSADALVRAARTARDALSGDPEDPTGDVQDVGTLLAAALRSLSQEQDADPELADLGARVADLAALATEVGADLRDYASRLDADPERLEQVEARRAQVIGLVRKYADGPDPDLAAVGSWAAAARRRLAEIDVSDEALSALRDRADHAGATAAHLAADLSARRAAAAPRLAAAVTAELAGLAMPGAQVVVAVALRAVGKLPSLEVPSIDGPGTASAGAVTDGVDEVQILLRPHPGAPALPIARSASGGELSRVMLALEVCVVGADADDPSVTLVFDEVDAGVGGRAAVEVGRRLARLARGRQVLVVTHLAQVAAFADRHVVVDKTAGTGITASDVRMVEDAERVGELARMLAGSDSAVARDHAAELLADAAHQRAGAPAPADGAIHVRTGRKRGG